MDLFMRRLTSKYQEERGKKRNQILIGLILIFVMFSSVLGFAFLNHSFIGGGNAQRDNFGSSNVNVDNFNSINYNGFEFIEQNNFWILNLNEVNFIFRHNPTQVPRIASEIKPLETYQEKVLYLYSEDILAESEIKINLLQFTNGIEKACLKEEKCGENVPVKTCEDNFIIIREGNQSITQEDNCVFIEGKKEDLTKLADEFLFKLMGI